MYMAVIKFVVVIYLAYKVYFVGLDAAARLGRQFWWMYPSAVP